MFYPSSDTLFTRTDNLNGFHDECFSPILGICCRRCAYNSVLTLVMFFFLILEYRYEFLIVNTYTHSWHYVSTNKNNENYGTEMLYIEGNRFSIFVKKEVHWQFGLVFFFFFFCECLVQRVKNRTVLFFRSQFFEILFFINKSVVRWLTFRCLVNFQFVHFWRHSQQEIRSFFKKLDQNYSGFCSLFRSFWKFSSQSCLLNGNWWQMIWILCFHPKGTGISSIFHLPICPENKSWRVVWCGSYNLSRLWDEFIQGEPQSRKDTIWKWDFFDFENVFWEFCNKNATNLVTQL